ncbi:hypothetical protein DYQ86_15670 [Acidobacteria bacterium AB60]|nr:hypothetical protein DYQ86_15670 [Acidobacteria bacterium AB60]
MTAYVPERYGLSEIEDFNASAASMSRNCGCPEQNPASELVNPLRIAAPERGKIVLHRKEKYKFTNPFDSIARSSCSGEGKR